MVWSTDIRAPCHVPRTRQLKPNIDRRLKFRFEVIVSLHRKNHRRPGLTRKTGFLPACLRAKLSLSSLPSDLRGVSLISRSSIGSWDWSSDSFAILNVCRRDISRENTPTRSTKISLLKKKSKNQKTSLAAEFRKPLCSYGMGERSHR